MANDNNVEYERDSSGLQTSISYYIHTIEELYKAVEAKKEITESPSYFLSLQILGQILQQMKNLKERRLSFNALEELLWDEKLFFSQPGQGSMFEKFPMPFNIDGNSKEGEQFNWTTEEEAIPQTQDEVGLYEIFPEIQVNNSIAPPPWKPKNKSRQL